MRAAGLSLLVFAACGSEAPCPPLPSGEPLQLGPEREPRRIEVPQGWTVTASVSGPFAWRADTAELLWASDGYAEGRLRLRFTDPTGRCPATAAERAIQASTFERPRLKWIDSSFPDELPAGTAVGVELRIRNEGWTGRWLPAAQWQGTGAALRTEGPTWVPPLGLATQRVSLVAEGGAFAGRLGWEDLGLERSWRGEGLVPRLTARGNLDFGEVLVGDLLRETVVLQSLNEPVEIVHIEGPWEGPFEWSAPTFVDGTGELSVRFAPDRPGAWSERLQVWWRGRERIEVHELRVSGCGKSCDELCHIPGAKASCGGGCRIERCEDGLFDANLRLDDGCECADGVDPPGDCARATKLEEIRDDGSRVSADGILAGSSDRDVFRLIAADGSNLFREHFDLRVEVEADPGVELCVRRARGRWPLGSCAPAELECGPRHRFEGRFLRDDTQTLWLHLRNRAPSCAAYRVRVSNG